MVPRIIRGTFQMLRKSLLGLCLLMLPALPAKAKTIDIRIGHQSMCTDTYAAGEVVMNLHLLQKYLPHSGKYANTKFHIKWENYTSGGPITQMMLAGKLDFGVMGDYPLVVNGARFQATPTERSYLIALTDYNLIGASNGIVVPTASRVTNVRQLRGKTISVPIGSAAWGMLYEMAQDKHIPISSFHIINQTPMVGIASIATDKVAAHADFCPMSEFMEYEGTGRMIYSGAETKVPYLHGVVVTKTFADKYPAIVVAYIKALIAAEKWMSANPERAAVKLASWTMVPKEVLYLYFSNGGYLHPDPTFKPLWIKTLEHDHSILAKYAHIPPLDMKKFADPKFMEKAYSELGLNYQKALKQPPHNPKSNIALPPEIWIDGKHVQKVASVTALMDAIRAAGAAKQKVAAAYVYDDNTGIKLFAQYAYYVEQPDKKTVAYMTLGEAKRFAAGGKVVTFAKALGDPEMAHELLRRRQGPMQAGAQSVSQQG